MGTLVLSVVLLYVTHDAVRNSIRFVLKRFVFCLMGFLCLPVKAELCSEAYFTMARENTWRVNEVLDGTGSHVEHLAAEIKGKIFVLNTRNAEQWAKELKNEVGAMRFGFWGIESAMPDIKKQLADIDARIAQFVEERHIGADLWRPAVKRCLEVKNYEQLEIAEKFLQKENDYEFDILVFSEPVLNGIRKDIQHATEVIQSVRQLVPKETN